MLSAALRTVREHHMGLAKLKKLLEEKSVGTEAATPTSVDEAVKTLVEHVFKSGEDSPQRNDSTLESLQPQELNPDPDSSSESETWADSRSLEGTGMNLDPRKVNIATVF